jgi:hypothetical protein
MVPEEKYKKYIKNAIGFTMIIIVIKPVLQVADIEEIPDFAYYYKASEYSLMDSDRSYYSDIMSQMVQDYIQDSYGIECQVSITWNENNEIEKMDIYNPIYEYTGNNEAVTEYELTDETIYQMKGALSYRYGIDIDSINMN